MWILWCSSARRKSTIPPDHLRIGHRFLIPSTSTSYLGILFDSEMSFKAHITKVVSSCFGVLRQIRSVRRSLPRPLLIKLIESLVVSRLDYCISILYGIPRKLSDRLQYVLRASARLIFRTSRFSSVSPLLQDLGWLPVEIRIQQRLAVMVHSCLHGRSPAYLADELQCVSALPGRSRLRSASTQVLAVPKHRHKTFGGRSFPVSASRAWNSLPPELMEVNDSRHFKELLKRFLLSEYLL